MVRALLDGRKTQTRRVLKLDPAPVEYDGMWMWGNGIRWGAVTNPTYPPLPHAPGDRLWVKEAHYLTDDGDGEYAVYAEDQTSVAEHLESMARLQRSHPQVNWSKHLRLRPSIHMPRWASRITLTVTDVRVQRLQDISEDDAKAEGVRPAFSYPGWDAVSSVPKYRWGLHEIWNSLHGPDAWDANPWVWVKTFTVQHGNIDSIGGGE
jgi:hypothetical protein